MILTLENLSTEKTETNTSENIIIRICVGIIKNYIGSINKKK